MNEVYVLESTAKKDLYFSKALSQVVKIEKKLLHPFLRGEDIRRYTINSSPYSVIIPYQILDKSGQNFIIDSNNLSTNLPNTWQYLKNCEKQLRGRERGKMDCDEWYGYVYPKNLNMFGKSRIIARDIIERGSFALDIDGLYAFVSGYGYVLKDIYSEHIEFVLGLLNSAVLTDYLKKISTTLRGGWFRPFPQFVGQLPIKLPETKEEKKLANRVVERVKRIIENKKKLQAKKLGQNVRERLERQVESDESRIDELVCELYGVDEIPEI